MTTRREVVAAAGTATALGAVGGLGLVAGLVGGYRVTIEPTSPTTSGGAEPAAEVAGLELGVSVDPTEYESRLPAHEGAFGPSRVFWKPGAGLPSWDDSRVRRIKAVDERRRLSFCFKDWQSDAFVRTGVRALIERARTDGETFDLAHMHEPGPKDFDPREWRRRQFVLDEWIGDDTDVCTLTPTEALQWVMSNKDGKGKGDLSIYYAGVGVPSIDCYWDSWADEYPSAAAFLAPALRLQDAAGKPVRLPEFGGARIKSDTSGAGRAALITAVCDLARAEGVALISYWDDIGTGGTDIRLGPVGGNTPEQQAWRAQIAH